MEICNLNSETIRTRDWSRFENPRKSEGWNWGFFSAVSDSKSRVLLSHYMCVCICRSEIVCDRWTGLIWWNTCRPRGNCKYFSSIFQKFLPPFRGGNWDVLIVNFLQVPVLKEFTRLFWSLNYLIKFDDIWLSFQKT